MCTYTCTYAKNSHNVVSAQRMRIQFGLVLFVCAERAEVSFWREERESVMSSHRYAGLEAVRCNLIPFDMDILTVDGKRPLLDPSHLQAYFTVHLGR